MEAYYSRFPVDWSRRSPISCRHPRAWPAGASASHRFHEGDGCAGQARSSPRMTTKWI